MSDREVAKLKNKIERLEEENGELVSILARERHLVIVQSLSVTPVAEICQEGEEPPRTLIHIYFVDNAWGAYRFEVTCEQANKLSADLMDAAG